MVVQLPIGPAHSKYNGWIPREVAASALKPETPRV
jgi:hypothetical protein